MSADNTRAKFEAWYANDARHQGIQCTADDVAALREGDGYGDDRIMLNGKWGGWKAAIAADRAARGVPDVDAIMSLAQEMASAWSLIGSRFDHGDAMQHFDEEKQKLRAMLAAAPQPAAQPADLSDAYHGAREDLSIWKKRALEAEETVRQLNRALAEEVNGPTFMGEPAAQPDRQQMTPEQVKELMAGMGYNIAPPQAKADFINGARNAEAFHGITNETKRGGA